jgi:hypothetical protein
LAYTLPTIHASYGPAFWDIYNFTLFVIHVHTGKHLITSIRLLIENKFIYKAYQNAGRLWNYSHCVTVCHFWFFAKIAPRMQEIAFLSLRKSNIFWGNIPQRLDSVSYGSAYEYTIINIKQTNIL